MGITDHPGFRAALSECTAYEAERIIAAVEALEELPVGSAQSATGGFRAQPPSTPDQAPYPNGSGHSLPTQSDRGFPRTLSEPVENSACLSSLTAGEIMALEQDGVHASKENA